MTKGVETKSAILDQALAMASTIGLEGLSIGELAKAVGLSKSGLFAHFSSKENLQYQVLEAARDRFVEIVVAPSLRKPRGEPRLRALLDNMFVWENAKFMPGGCIFISAAVELDDQPGPLRDFLVSAQKDWINTLSTSARIAIEEGHFRPDVDPEQFAFEFHAAILVSNYARRLMHDPQAETRARVMMESLIDRCRVQPKN